MFVFSSWQSRDLKHQLICYQFILKTAEHPNLSDTLHSNSHHQTVCVYSWPDYKPFYHNISTNK